MDKKEQLNGVTIVGDDIKMKIGGELYSMKALVEEVNTKLTWMNVAFLTGVFLAAVSLIINLIVVRHLDLQTNYIKEINSNLIQVERRLNDKMDFKFQQIDQRFQQIDQRFDKIDQRFQQMDQRFDKMDIKFEKIEDKLDYV